MQQIICLVCILGVLLTQTLIGGARLVFGVPGYILVALAGVMVLFLPVRKAHPGFRAPAIVATLVMIGYVVARTYSSPIEYLARSDRFMVLAALVVYLLTACYLTNPKQRLWIVYTFLGFSLLHIAGGVLQFARNDNFMFLSLIPAGFPIPEIFRGADYGWRASGFYVCPNHLAGLLEMLALIALARCIFGRAGAFGRVLALYFAISALAGLALTGSRGGYLSISAGFVAMFCISLWAVRKVRSRKLWIKFAVAGGIGIILVVGVLFLMTQSALIDRRLEQIADTKNMRIYMWAAALKQFQLSPLFGTGSGTYLYFGRQFRSTTVQNDPQHVHNDYLELLCEYGVLGVVLFAVFLGLHLYYGFRTLSSIVQNRLRPAKKMQSNEFALLVGVLAALGALLVHSIVDFNCHVPGNVLFVAFLFGVLANPTTDQKLTPSPPPGASQAARFVIPAVSIALLVLTVPLMRGEYHAEWARVHLRNQIYYRVLAQFQTQVGWSAAGYFTGIPLPASGTEARWVENYLHDQVMPKTIKHAEAGLASEKENPDLYYYLGEARHFLALTAPEDTGRKQKFAEAGDAYYEGYRIFPYDARLQLKLARTYDNVGLIEAADKLYNKALEADPNLGNISAYYGHHLLMRRKLLRSEAYFRRALALDHENRIARAGLEEIAKIRALSKNPAFIEENGDLMDTYDLEPPTPEDEAHGAVLPAADE